MIQSKTDFPEGTWLSIAEARDLLPSRPHYRTVMRWIKAGRVRSRYLRGRRLVHSDDLLQAVPSRHLAETC